jgi:hypothetical protein
MTFLDRAGVTGPRAVVEPRGTGASAWGEELAWHLRRAAAWTGRTLASLRVWDTLRGLAAVRALPAAAGRPVVLAARGEMTAVALYAALLDGAVSRLILEGTPPTLDAASRPDGRGPAIELLGALAVADLPAVIALIGVSNIRFMEG